MRDMNQFLRPLLRAAAIATAALAAGGVQAAAPGITGTSGPAFDLVAKDGYISQPDGASIYTWGYGCNTAPGGFVPATITGGSCPPGSMQLPGPTLVVKQGDTVTVTLHNALPLAAGNTSILFPGFNVTAAVVGTCSSTATAGFSRPKSLTAAR